MIMEALNFVATWPVTPAEFRPFIRSSVSLWSRAGRCRDAWRAHEDHCHRAILAAVADLRSRRTCVVLGSGLLRDVPVRALAERFDSVVLVDLVHLAPVRARAAFGGLKTLRFVHRDLSGLDDIRAGRAPEPLAFLRGVPYLDFVISANLLSQIGVGVTRMLEQDATGDRLPPDAAARLIGAHVEGLAQLPCPALLLTDIRFDILNREGAVEDGTDLMHGVPLPEEEASWIWPVAPLGEISKNYALQHRVVAVRLNFPRDRQG
jgi:hypothetical protein